ncbi:MAG: S-layer homology domain-containing protein, partial [Clostridia bacterium]|nr:S-layer homology domain-containing protein [Clostridia bacterium]
MKKIISMLLASTLAASCVMPVMAANRFSDVKEGHWAKEYVEDMAKKGLISGFDDGTYKPEQDVSRRDAFALFARLMGSNSETNKDVLEIAKETYKDVLADYDLTYAEGDISYLLYRGVITEKELDKYFKDTKKTEAMPRYEAAILITKAMLAEDTATNEVLIDMDYSDVADIPSEAKQYVYYVSQKGIMLGSDNKFSPNGPVQRGQIAVMLSKTANSANYYFEATTLEKVDADSDNIKIKDYEAEIGYSKDTLIFKDGKKVDDKVLLPCQEVVITYAEDDGGVKVVYIDVLATAITGTTKAIYKGYSSNEGKVQVSVEDPATGETSQYECSSDIEIKVGNDEVNIAKVKAGEYVELSFAGDVVVEIATITKTESVSDATLTAIDPKGVITISHKDEKYNGMEIALGSKVRIEKDNKTAEFADLYRGDKLKLKFEYGVLTELSAQSSRKTISGVLVSYTVSGTPTLTINVDGEEKTYDIPADISIKVDGKDGKLADFEVGSSIKITVESEAIIKIEATASVGVVGSKVAGEVVSVNATAKSIEV